jgi:hypothetical protein
MQVIMCQVGMTLVVLSQFFMSILCGFFVFL